MALTWTVNIKWDGTNNVNEAARLQEISIKRGRKFTVRSDGKGFEPQAVGEATLTLRNTDGRYDALNSGSAIYPNCAPGKVVTLTLSDGTSYDMFTGHISDIRAMGHAGARSVQVVVRDGWQWLKQRRITYAPQTDLTTDAAINNAATNAEYPFTTALSAGNDIIPYWWSDDQDGASAIQSLADSEFGLVYVAANGTLTYKPRSYQWSAASSATWTESDLNEINFAQPWETVRNVVQVRVYPTDTIPPGTDTNMFLWQSSKTFKLRPTKTLTINVEYLYNGQKTSAIDVITPVASTDYRAFANANGVGDDLTSDIALTFTEKGESAQIVLTNNNTTRVAYITFLRVRGTVLNKQNALTVKKDTSGGTNRRSFLLDVKWQQDAERAQLFADYLASILDDTRAAPTLRTNRAGLAKQCVELNTVITLNLSSLGLNKQYRISGIEQHWDAVRLNTLTTKMYCETKDVTTYFTLNTSTLNSTHVLAY